MDEQSSDEAIASSTSRDPGRAGELLKRFLAERLLNYQRQIYHTEKEILTQSETGR